LERG